MNRREVLRTLTAGALLAAAEGKMAMADDGAANSDGSAAGKETAPAPAAKEIAGDPRVRGPFPILSTPFLESGEVDYETLAKQAKFVCDCDCSGMIWPQAGDAVDLLTKEEKMQGMAVLAEATRGRRTTLCLGVQGKNTAEMLEFAHHAETLEPTAIISRPPDEGKTEDDLRQYWLALAEVAKRPVIIQTSGGTAYHGVAPSDELMVELAKASPYFGYVKEETYPIEAHMRRLVSEKPVIKRVFSAMGGIGWLRQCRIGTEGLITERAVYADLLERIWQEYDHGNFAVAADAFSKFLLMMNLRETIQCNQLRGYHLYVWQKRGIFKNRLSREYGPKNAIPEKPILRDMPLTQEEMDEIDARFELLKPYLKVGV